MKKLFMMLLSLTLVLSLVGCSDVETADTGRDKHSPNQTEQVAEKGDIGETEETQTNEETELVQTESGTESKTEENRPKYNITVINKTMYAISIVDVRTEPDGNASRIGALSQNAEVAVTGVVDNGWYQIEYNRKEGYVEESSLSFEKKIEQESSSNENNSSNSSTSSETKPSGNAGGSGVTVPSTGDTQGNLVWIPTNGGTKYHSKSSCSNMKDPMQVTREHAEANGFTPCKRCY